jgi:nucleotide-binding universal stress UspA family protein
VAGILVPLGGALAGSTQDDEVVRLACMLARQAKAPVCFLHVIQVPRTLAVDAELPAQTHRGDEILLRAESEAQRLGVQTETALAQAREIGPAIVNEAVDRDSALIVIAIDPDRRSGSFHIGQIASYVMEHAPCAVVAHRMALASEPPPARGR